jgi:hypothetical protein
MEKKNTPAAAETFAFPLRAAGIWAGYGSASREKANM